jgi:hypothetical protein
MSKKIQSKTILGWMDVLGTFKDTESASEYIESLRTMLCDPLYRTTLRIVDSNEIAINDYFLYNIEDIVQNVEI